MNELLLGLLITILPILELRGGLPLVVNYALKNNLSVFPFFLLVILLNIFVIFAMFFFLDYLHKYLMKIKSYQKGFDIYSKRLGNKVDKFKKKFGKLGFVALVLFVAVPLPGTGAYTGCFVAWILGLERKKSIVSIALGVFLAGLFILLGSLGLLSLFH